MSCLDPSERPLVGKAAVRGAETWPLPTVSISRPLPTDTRSRYGGLLGGKWRAFWWLTAAAVLLPSAVGAQCACACTTPVYRYAMYNWPVAPYYVFYFHHGQIASEDQAVHNLIRELGQAEPPANLVLELVDGTDQTQLEQLPQIVVDAWHACDDGAGEPVSLVYTAWGAHLFSGRLDEQTIGALVDSPARRQIGRLFDEGHAAVLLILTGPNAEQNARAEQAVEKLVADVAAGKFNLDPIDPYGLPGVEPPGFEQAEPPGMDQTHETGSSENTSAAEAHQPRADESEAEDTPLAAETPSSAEAANAAEPEEAPASFKLAVVKVARDETAEQWLVRSLLAVEPDLDEFPEEPMVFAIYGRGRALPPFIGKGINYENLVQCVYFLIGPCSCMIKDQNPGMDLLTCWDWEKTAEKWMATDEMLAQDDWQYQYPYYPDQEPPAEEGPMEEGMATAEPRESVAPLPGEPAALETGTAEPGPTAPGTSQPPAEALAADSFESAAPDDHGASVAKSTSGGQAAGATSIASASQPGEAVLPPCCVTPGGDQPSESLAATQAVRRQVWIAGALLGGGALVVIALGFVVLRAGSSS